MYFRNLKYLILSIFIMLLFSCDQQNFQNIDNVISQLKSFEISDCVAHDVNQALPSGVIAYEFCNIEDKWDIKIHLYEVDAEDTCRKHVRCLQSMKYYEEWETENPHLKDYVGIQLFKETILIILEPSLKSGGWETERTRDDVYNLMKKDLDL
mgnify:CR=1 FL=1